MLGYSNSVAGLPSETTIQGLDYNFSYIGNNQIEFSWEKPTLYNNAFNISLQQASNDSQFFSASKGTEVIDFGFGNIETFYISVNSKEAINGFWEYFDVHIGEKYVFKGFDKELLGLPIKIGDQFVHLEINKDQHIINIVDTVNREIIEVIDLSGILDSTESFVQKTSSRLIISPDNSIVYSILGPRVFKLDLISFSIVDFFDISVVLPNQHSTGLFHVLSNNNLLSFSSYASPTSGALMDMSNLEVIKEEPDLGSSKEYNGLSIEGNYYHFHDKIYSVLGNTLTEIINLDFYEPEWKSFFLEDIDIELILYSRQSILKYNLPSSIPLNLYTVIGSETISQLSYDKYSKNIGFIVNSGNFNGTQYRVLDLATASIIFEIEIEIENGVIVKLVQDQIYTSNGLRLKIL
jgi:hypothetical protein